MKRLFNFLFCLMFFLPACVPMDSPQPGFLVTVDTGDTLTLTDGDVTVAFTVQEPEAGWAKDIHRIKVDGLVRRVPYWWDYDLGNIDPAYGGIILRSHMADLDVLVVPPWKAVE